MALAILLGIVTLGNACSPTVDVSDDDGLPPGNVSFHDDEASSSEDSPTVRDRPLFTNPTPFPISTLRWSTSGTVSGQNCVHWREDSDRNGWGSNYYLCTMGDFGLTFHSAGEPSDKVCVRILEASDTQGTWGDNYLCGPRNYGLQWSSNGAISGMDCVQITAPMMPLAGGLNIIWSDNFLCRPRPR